MKPARRGAVLLLLFTAVLQIGVAGWGSLYNETDGQYAGAARMMAEGGDWLIPENNGIPRLIKPPLLYWLMAAGMGSFGVGEFAARLPNALAVVALVAITLRIGSIWGGVRRGVLAGTVLATTLGIFTLARIVMPEPGFSALIAGALWCFLEVFSSDRPGRWMLAFWTLGGLAAFIKGPHGLAYPVAVAGFAILGMRLTSPKTRPGLRDLFSPTGLLIAALINLPWYFYVESRFPGFLANLFSHEYLGHVAGSSTPATHYSNVPRGTFLALHLAWFFPWSVAALIVLPRARATLVPPAHWSPVAWVIVGWVVVIGGTVLAAGQRQDYYAMSLWPALALLVARLIEGQRLRAACGAVAITLAVVLGACWTLPLWLETASTGTLEERATALTTVLHFGPEVWQGLMRIATFSLLPAIGAAAFGGFRPRSAFLGLALAGASVGLGAVAGTARVAPYFSVATMASRLESETGREGLLVFDGDIDTASSLLFYTRLPVHLLGANPQSDFSVRTHGIGRDRYLDARQLASLWSSPQKVVLITESSRLPAWESQLGPLTPFAHCGTLAAIHNGPSEK